MASVEIYYYDKKIKTFKDVSEKSVEGIIDFIIHAVNTLGGPNGVIIVNNKLVESTEKLEDILVKALNKGKNIKVEIKSIIPFEEVRRDLEANILRQIRSVKPFLV